MAESGLMAVIAGGVGTPEADEPRPHCVPLALAQAPAPAACAAELEADICDAGIRKHWQANASTSAHAQTLTCASTSTRRAAGMRTYAYAAVDHDVRSIVQF